MGRGIVSRLALVPRWCSSAAFPAFAQQQTGDLYGTVTDDQKSALPGGDGHAHRLGSAAGAADRRAGEVPLRQPVSRDSYNLKAELEGFSTWSARAWASGSAARPLSRSP